MTNNENQLPFNFDDDDKEVQRLFDLSQTHSFTHVAFKYGRSTISIEANGEIKDGGAMLVTEIIVDGIDLLACVREATIQGSAQMINKARKEGLSLDEDVKVFFRSDFPPDNSFHNITFSDEPLPLTDENGTNLRTTKTKTGFFRNFTRRFRS